MTAQPPMTTNTAQTPIALLTLREAARLLRLPARAVMGRIAAGELPAFRLKGSGLIRLRREDAEALLEETEGQAR